MSSFFRPKPPKCAQGGGLGVPKMTAMHERRLALFSPSRLFNLLSQLRRPGIVAVAALQSGPDFLGPLAITGVAHRLDLLLEARALLVRGMLRALAERCELLLPAANPIGGTVGGHQLGAAAETRRIAAAKRINLLLEAGDLLLIGMIGALAER